MRSKTRDFIAELIELGGPIAELLKRERAIYRPAAKGTGGGKPRLSLELKTQFERGRRGISDFRSFSIKSCLRNWVSILQTASIASGEETLELAVFG
jgi:hypothetical protein